MDPEGARGKLQANLYDTTIQSVYSGTWSYGKGINTQREAPYRLEI